MSTRDELQAQAEAMERAKFGDVAVRPTTILALLDDLADLEAGARGLLDALTRTHVEVTDELWDACIRVRALIGNETRPPADTDTGRGQ